MAKKKDEKDVLVVRDEKTGEISVVAGLNADTYYVLLLIVTPSYCGKWAFFPAVLCHYNTSMSEMKVFFFFF